MGGGEVPLKTLEAPRCSWCLGHERRGLQVVGEDTSGAVVLLGFPNMRLLAARSHCFRWFAVIEDVVDGFGSVAVVPGGCCRVGPWANSKTA